MGVSHERGIEGAISKDPHGVFLKKPEWCCKELSEGLACQRAMHKKWKEGKPNVQPLHVGSVSGGKAQNESGR